MSSNNVVKIVSSYTSKFGELWDKSLNDLIKEVVLGVIENVFKKGGVGQNFDPKEIDAVYISNMASGLFDNQLHLNAMVSQLFEHFPPSMRIEGACASGSLALVAAQDALNSGRYKTVMVLGVEKMTDLSSGEVTKVLASASDYDFEYGSTFPALYALLAKAHVDKYGTTRKQLSSVSVKNHRHALNNSKAHFRKSFSLEQVSKSAMVADPLRLLDCSPVSDGASAVILSIKEFGKTVDNKKSNGKMSYKSKPKIIGFGHAQDSLSLANRKNLTSLEATKKAGKDAFEQAGIYLQNRSSFHSKHGVGDSGANVKNKFTPKNISVAEVHDCFTIAEILAIEDLGFFKKGEGAKATLDGKTTFGGEIVINPSGGLKACGHPVGATGVKQVAYLAEFLEKGSSKYALAHNVGGSGATAVVHILEK